MDLLHIYQVGSVVISALKMGFTDVRVNNARKKIYGRVFSFLSYASRKATKTYLFKHFHGSFKQGRSTVTQT
jgi:hypothetical protein